MPLISVVCHRRGDYWMPRGMGWQMHIWRGGRGVANLWRRERGVVIPSGGERWKALSPARTGSGAGLLRVDWLP